MATLSIVGKMPVDNDILNISTNWVEISFQSSFNILIGMLFGPTDLFQRRYYIPFFLFIARA